MIKIENYEVMGWEHAIRGMRNPMNSWERMDSIDCRAQRDTCNGCQYADNNDTDEMCPGNQYYLGNTNMCGFIGPNDQELMEKLAKGGPVHAKYRRMITVYVDITAPLYFWKEFDTYKVGTVANSCSTMHKIHAKEFTLDDFSHEHLFNDEELQTNTDVLQFVIDALNFARDSYIETKDKTYWWQMIQLLPSSYNQKRTVMLNYEVLANMYKWRRAHKLDEWVRFCEWIENLPHSWIITGEKNEH